MRSGIPDLIAFKIPGELAVPSCHPVMPQFREGDPNFALVASASAFLAVGFSMPNAQAHDELKNEFIVATQAFGAESPHFFLLDRPQNGPIIIPFCE